MPQSLNTDSSLPIMGEALHDRQKPEQSDGRDYMHAEAMEIMRGAKDPSEQSVSNPNDKLFQNPNDALDKVSRDFREHGNLSVQDRADMERAIKLADGLDQKDIGDELQKVQQKLKDEIKPEDQKKIDDAGQAYSKALQSLGAGGRDFMDMVTKLSEAKTDDEKSAISKALHDKYPDADQKRLDFEAAQAPFKSDLDYEDKLRSLQTAPSRLRFEYGSMLRNQTGIDDTQKSTDTRQADRLFQEALAKAPADYNAFLESVLNQTEQSKK